MLAEIVVIKRSLVFCSLAREIPVRGAEVLTGRDLLQAERLANGTYLWVNYVPGIKGYI